MDNVNVVYATKTQHSRKIAEAVGQGLGVKAKNIAEYPQPEPTGLLFLVGGIYGGKGNPDLLSYADKLDSSLAKKVVLVTSSVSVQNRKQKELRELLEDKGIDIVDEITCQGAFLLIGLNHPNEADIQGIAQKAKEISNKAV